jgi:hypothetical protein
VSHIGLLSIRHSRPNSNTTFFLKKKKKNLSCNCSDNLVNIHFVAPDLVFCRARPENSGAEDRVVLPRPSQPFQSLVPPGHRRVSTSCRRLKTSIGSCQGLFGSSCTIDSPSSIGTYKVHPPRRDAIILISFLLDSYFNELNSIPPYISTWSSLIELAILLRGSQSCR